MRNSGYECGTVGRDCASTCGCAGRAILASPTLAWGTPLATVAEGGVRVQGRPLKGSPQLSASHQAKRLELQFLSTQHRNLLDFARVCGGQSRVPRAGLVPVWPLHCRPRKTKFLLAGRCSSQLSPKGKESPCYVGTGQGPFDAPE